MIDPRELKLGNYIFDEEGCFIKITGFQPHGHSTRCDEPEGCILLFDIYSQDGKIREGYENESDSCNPIPLTPEWLERCGFIDRAGNGLAYRMEINSLYELCWYKQDEFLRYQTIGNGFTRTLEHVKHLHQLQNFFYWHTGQELTIKSFN